MVNVADINEFEEVPVRSGDMLEQIFSRQRELMLKYEEIERKNGMLQTPDVPVDLDDPMGQARLKDFAWRLTEEIGEAMNCLKNKPWKQSHMHTDTEHYLEEIVDAFHFFIELSILSGFTPEMLFDTYMDKSAVNKFRQRSGY